MCQLGRYQFFRSFATIQDMVSAAMSKSKVSSAAKSFLSFCDKEEVDQDIINDSVCMLANG